MARSRMGRSGRGNKVHSLIMPHAINQFKNRISKYFINENGRIRRKKLQTKDIKKIIKQAMQEENIIRREKGSIVYKGTYVNKRFYIIQDDSERKAVKTIESVDEFYNSKNAS